jgi:hypothetical protein
MPFPLDSKFVDETERKLGVTFPSMFRGRMLKDNGGSVQAGDDDWQLFPFFDDTDRKRVGRTANDIVRETTRAREWPNFPPGAVAIASNGTGDLLDSCRRPTRGPSSRPGFIAGATTTARSSRSPTASQISAKAWATSCGDADGDL